MVYIIFFIPLATSRGPVFVDACVAQSKIRSSLHGAGSSLFPARPNFLEGSQSSAAVCSVRPPSVVAENNLLREKSKAAVSAIGYT